MPWLVVFSSEKLDALTDALAAQPTPRRLGLYATLDGHPRPLDPDEQIALYRHLLDRCPGDTEATAALAAARDESVAWRGAAP